jgi:predicted negative regulator of RcsB-dependent stress response
MTIGRRRLYASSSIAVLLCVSSSGWAQQLSTEAYQHATEAYRAIQSNDLEKALREARIAVAHEPSSATTRRLLAEVLISRKQFDLAQQVLDGAVQRGVVDGPLYIARGYLDMDQNKPAQAVDDFRKALTFPNDDTAAVRNVRLSMADAALAAKQPAAAVEALEPLHDDASGDVAGRLGQAYSALGRNQDAAKEFAAAAAASQSPEQHRNEEKAEAQAESASGAKAEAGKLAEKLTTEDGCDLDLAYILIAADDDKAALAYFDGPCKSQLTARTQIDAGNTAVRLIQNDEALEHFQSALALNRAAPDPKPLDPVTVFSVRRQDDILEREWGVNASYAFLADRPDTAGGSVSQALVEAYWQPPDIGYRDGSTFQVFGRVTFNALVPGETGLGLNGTELSIGGRWKPFGDQNLILEAERLIPLGSKAYADWLLRGAYSDGFGTDLDPVNNWWWFGQYYGEGDYFPSHDWHFGYGDARAGATTYISEGSPEWTASAFGDIGAYYDDTELRRFSAGIGPGVGVRYWFRETENRAPPSFAELDFIYRVKLTPSDRAGGILLQLNVAY